MDSPPARPGTSIVSTVLADAIDLKQKPTEWPPLRTEGGLQYTARAEFERATVTAFEPNCAHRRVQIQKFFLWFDNLLAFGLDIEVWVDGSFCTLKPTPNDIDVVVMMRSEQIDSMEQELQEACGALFDRPRVQSLYGLDVYMADVQSDEERHRWLQMFGFARDNVTPKGIFALRAP